MLYFFMLGGWAFLSVVQAGTFEDQALFFWLLKCSAVHILAPLGAQAGWPAGPRSWPLLGALPLLGLRYCRRLSLGWKSIAVKGHWVSAVWIVLAGPDAVFVPFRLVRKLEGQSVPAGGLFVEVWCVGFGLSVYWVFSLLEFVHPQRLEVSAKPAMSLYCLLVMSVDTRELVWSDRRDLRFRLRALGLFCGRAWSWRLASASRRASWAASDGSWLRGLLGRRGAGRAPLSPDWTAATPRRRACRSPGREGGLARLCPSSSSSRLVSR